MKQDEQMQCNHMHGGSSSNAVYGLGLIGALIYFLQNANSFQDGVIGVLKALAWPAFLVYQALGLFKI